jgi:ubiquinone/menaquinone biosynthesis C-methylase UbiE
MLFPDVPAALNEMMRVTKSGGTLAFVVWGRNEANPFGHTVTDVLSQYWKFQQLHLMHQVHFVLPNQGN